jgi:uridine phosphorylase
VRPADVNHLRPTAALSERVLLPGDPHRALAVAQALLERPPRMFNHSRGLWGYTGIARDGEPLTVQSTGIGGPSAAIVCEELIALGARRLVRIGTCAALVEELALGSLLAPECVLPLDGASTAVAVEMETAAILSVARRHGVAAACVLGVARRARPNGATRLDREELDALGLRLGETGWAAFRSP